jgi:8-oxo-dGTP diphosphatase
MSKVQHDSETPAHGQQVIVACAAIHRTVDDVPEIFMAQRSLVKKFYPGVFELPGGHIDYGEDIRAGLKREIREELGAEVELGEPFSAFTYINDIKGAHTVEIAFFARFAPGSEWSLQPDDHSDARWFRQEQRDEYTVNRSPDDEESVVVQRAFAILKGEPLRT